MRTLLVALLLLGIAAAPASAAKTIVRYQSGGGLAGTSLDLRVRDDGKARLIDSGSVRAGESETKRRFSLSRAMLRRLRTDLKAARLKDCRPAYEPDVPIADGITQRVASKGTAVMVATGADPPRRLERLLGRLDRIVARHQ